MGGMFDQTSLILVIVCEGSCSIPHFQFYLYHGIEIAYLVIIIPFSIGLKTVITEFPHTDPIMLSNVCKKITSRLTAAISKQEDVSVQLEALDILGTLTSLFYHRRVVSFCLYILKAIELVLFCNVAQDSCNLYYSVFLVEVVGDTAKLLILIFHLHVSIRSLARKK